MKITPSTFIGVNNDKVISFGSGQPDLPPPPEAYECLPTYKDFKYGPVAGLQKLREVLAQKNNGFGPEHFVITNGASEALDLIFRVVLKPGDKVLVHKPYYYSYVPLLEKCHLEPVFVDTVEGKIDIQDFESKIGSVQVVLINSPCNPTGKIQEIKTLQRIEELTKELKLPLISDEVYKDLIYERENYTLSGPHVITVNSFSKTFAMCGFRVGYLFSNDLQVVQKVIDLKTHSSMNTNILGQEMAYCATTTPSSFLNEHLKIWEERRDTIYQGLVDLGFEVSRPQGAFYILPKVKDSMQFSIDMFEKYNVITYPGEWFGAPGYVRFSYAVDIEKIKEGLRRVKMYLEDAS